MELNAPLSDDHYKHPPLVSIYACHVHVLNNKFVLIKALRFLPVCGSSESSRKFIANISKSVFDL